MFLEDKMTEMSKYLGAQQTRRKWLKAGPESGRDTKRETLTESKNKGNLKVALEFKNQDKTKLKNNNWGFTNTGLLVSLTRKQQGPPTRQMPEWLQSR